MLKIVQVVINTPLNWYASRFNLTKQQVKLTIWFIIIGTFILNLIIAALVLLGMLPA